MPKFRLIISSMRPELVMALKTGLQGKPVIDMVITVSKPAEAENKFSRAVINVLLVDLDGSEPDMVKINSFRVRNKCAVLYTSVSASRGKFEGRAGDDFLLKPVTFTPLTSAAFAANLYKRLENYVKQILPPVTRDLGKLVSDNSNTKVVAIAASTGGTTAFEQILKQLPAEDAPPIVIVQHMPSGFTKLFADRLNAVYKQDIKEAETGDYIKRGQVLLAPAEKHMRIIRQNGRFAVECFIGTKIHGVMPAADVLFESAAEICKSNAVGVILTGMGSDGARGLLQMHNAGAATVGQDEKTSVVYGMPKMAKQIGAVDYELPLNKIADKIVSLA